MRFIKPLDTDLLKNLTAEISTIVTIEENVKAGGFGSAVLEALNDMQIYGFKMKRIGIDDTFVEHGPQDLLRTKYGFSSESIVSSVVELLS
jgi:1-deoxy-D-xylulose-5-phosphate synthase